MKIAVVHNLPPGGQKRALYEQVKILKKNYTLDLFTLSSTNESFLPLLPLVQNHYTVTYDYPDHFPKSVISIYKDLPKAYRFLAEMINRGGYNVAYVNPCYLTAAPYILRFLRIPSLYYCPEPKREFYEKIPHFSNYWRYLATYPSRLPIKKIDQINTKHATRILTNSKYSKTRIEQVYEVSSFVNYLGVDTDLFKPCLDSSTSAVRRQRLCRRHGESPDSVGAIPEVSLTPSVLTVGEFSLHKGHDFIIKSLSLIPSSTRPKLVIVGHGGVEKKYLQQLAEQLRVEVKLEENISDKKLVFLYNKAKLFLYAPAREPFGMVLLEAASCGLPIMAVEEGGIPEVVTCGKLGILAPRKEDEFAKAIQAILLKKVTTEDKHKRHEYIKKHWSWEKSVGELEKHLKEIAL